MLSSPKRYILGTIFNKSNRRWLLRFLSASSLLLFTLIIINVRVKRSFEVVYLNPERLSNNKYEAIRLNEQFAVIQYKCNNLANIEDTYSFCVDMLRSRDLVVVHKVWSSSQLKHSLLFIDALKRHQYYQIDQNQISVIEVAINAANPDDQLRMMHTFLTDNSDYLHSLHLTISIGSLLESVDIYPIYRAINDLFHKYQLVLYEAQQTGSCGRLTKNCKFLVSYYKIPVPVLTEATLLPALTAPVTGLGSPTEEAQRLAYAMLREPTYKSLCKNPAKIMSRTSEFDLRDLVTLNLWPDTTLWHLCADSLHMTSTCNVLIFQAAAYSPHSQVIQEEMKIHFQNEGCLMHIIDNTLPNSNANDLISHSEIAMIKHVRASVMRQGKVGTGQSSQQKETHGLHQTYMTIDVMLKLLALNKDKAINLVVIDLDGDEWHVMEAFLYSNDSLTILRRVHQISVRSRFFYGEENEVSRKHYSIHILLQWSGFQVYHRRKIPLTLYSGKIHASHCEFNSCYEIGYINTQFSL